MIMSSSQNDQENEDDDDDDDDDLKEINNYFTAPKVQQQQQQQQQQRQEVKKVVESLLDLTTNNANEDIFNNNQNQNQNQQLVQNLFQLTTQRAYSTTQMKSRLANNEDNEKDDKQRQQQQQQQQQQKRPEVLLPHYTFPFATRYKYHPAISNVALAQALWSTVVRPNVDTVIDATCGNGYDSVAIAKLLFQKTNNNNSNDEQCYAQLICLDVQREACENTRRALKETLSHQEDGSIDYYNDHVQVLHASHEVLPRPKNDSSVGLVVYNLGWLPNHTEKGCVTTMETTIASVTDAVLMIRVGGMLSIVTYPKTGPDEDCAVRLFVTCLALLSSNVRSWEDHLREETDNNINCPSNLEIIRRVEEAMGRVVQYAPGTTWRVSKHDKLGMDQAPILFTATRIK
jgi:hypothetical protein